MHIGRCVAITIISDLCDAKVSFVYTRLLFDMYVGDRPV